VNIFLRFSFVLLAASLGLYGILIGFLLLFTHMCALRSFGAPYFAPFAPVVFKELKDSVIRAPLWRMNTKPRSVTWQHRSLVNNDQDGEDR
jgi:spore germination protein KA